MGVRTPKYSGWGIPKPTILVHFVTCNWLPNCTTGVISLLVEICDVGTRVVFNCSFILGLFSPQNARKPFDDRALCTRRLSSWLEGVSRVPILPSSLPSLGTGKEGWERKEGRKEGWAPTIFET